eukprot:CAMPEP_0119303906 /NCGR_PEP_ID=MMETSP1333-20130426/5261_1 /TAXON_ID=418940 /ORGANISM="Scyphosphaera apsteinii, Strain RCC1455" /LENGTH=151 /DNA_ID=CAMNT_0007306685 /DNA_START=79 /DNA_END=534 /DNA_ORIENTATION=-
MVMILESGEIVQDSDPRAIAMRNKKTGKASSSTALGSGPATLPMQRPTGSSTGATPNAPAAPTASPLDTLAGAIGIQGQTIQIPALGRIPAKDVPLIAILLVGLLTLFFGWKVLLVAVVLHVFSGLSEAGVGPVAGRQQSRPPNPPGERPQ